MSEQKENQGKRLAKEGPGTQNEPGLARHGLPAGKPKKPPKYTGKAKAAYIAYVTLTVISALIVAGYIAFSFLSAPPPTPDYTRPPLPAATGSQGGDQPIFVPAISSERKEEFYTFVLVGQSEEAGAASPTP